MTAYLRANNLWDVIQNDTLPPQLRENATLAQIKQHDEEVAKHYRALSYLHSPVTEVVFTRIMACNMAKEAWSKLEEEFQGSDRTRQMQVLNLLREFEVLKMKDADSVKDYFDRVMKVVNQLRLLGETMPDKRVVEKVLVSILERFESKISSLEESKDLSKLFLTELVNALQASEHRRAIRLDDNTEHALVAKFKGKIIADTGKKGHNQSKEKRGTHHNKTPNKRSKFPICPHCKKRNHTEAYCWFKPSVRCHACNQYGHIEKWMFKPYDSKCRTFTELDHQHRPNVEIGNGDFLHAIGKGTVGIQTTSELRNKLQPKTQKGIFVGYSLESKAYRVYLIDSGKIFISRDVIFDEDHKWDWEEPQQKKSDDQNAVPSELDLDQIIDEAPVRGTRPIQDIYDRCQVAISEPDCFDEAVLYDEWKAAMKEEITMIEKNKTWTLVDIPKHRQVIGVK
ncbi:hypothetical protein QQP08_003116 [Theobroma cacao]|nr:hypothetical protein QQP08_003116 [Theobroma cacao]